MNELSVSPNECNAGSRAIQQIVTGVEDYDAMWYLSRTKAELDKVVEDFRAAMNNKYKDLQAVAHMNIPEETEAETKASMTKQREDAKAELNEHYRVEGDKKTTREMHYLPHSKVWPHIPAHFRPLLVDLMPFLTAPKDVE